MPFEFATATRILFGAGLLSEAAPAAAFMGRWRPAGDARTWRSNGRTATAVAGAKSPRRDFVRHRRTDH